MEARSVGGQWLKEHYNLVNYTMTHCSYIADNPAIRVTAKGNIEQDYGIKYAVAIENNALHHVEFFLKYDDLNLDFLQAVFQRISAAEIEAFISESPASRAARKIGFLYEFLTGKQLTLTLPVFGNYIDMLDAGNYIMGGTENNIRTLVYKNLLGK